MPSELPPLRIAYTSRADHESPVPAPITPPCVESPGLAGSPSIKPSWPRGSSGTRR